MGLLSNSKIKTPATNKIPAVTKIRVADFISSRRQRRVPVLPHRLVTKIADLRGDFVRRTFVGDLKLPGRIGRALGQWRPFAGTGSDFLDDAAFGVMDFFLARTGVAARLGVAAGAHHGDTQRNQAVTQ